MTIEKINKWCDNCPHVACETCQITWTDIEELKKDIKDNYIPKSKIETEIKYLNSKYDLENDYFKIETVINILRELLEESE